MTMPPDRILALLAERRALLARVARLEAALRAMRRIPYEPTDEYMEEYQAAIRATDAALCS